MSKEYIDEEMVKRIEKVAQQEAIDNTNSSEVLEDLEQLVEMADNCWVSCDVYKWKNTIKQYILKAQEQDFNYKNIVIPFFDELVSILGITDTDEMLGKIKRQKQAVSIIKEKNVDIELIKKSDSWLDYYTRYKHRTGYNTEIDDEEFDTVKEMIK